MMAAGSTMTERPRRRRAPKWELRLWAWIAGALAFLAPAAVFGAVPKPPQVAAGGSDRPELVIRRITRRIVITHPTAASQIRYVAGGSSGSSGVSSPAATSTGGS